MRNFVSSVVEVVGASSVSLGFFLWSVPAGFVVAGGFLLAGARQAAR